MNYLAHGIRFLDRPYLLAGTAMPDLLSVVDRNVRLRGRRIEPLTGDRDERVRQFAAGVLQHLHDDRWFHRTRAFFEVTGDLTRLFRRHRAGDERFRASFLGHIVTELLLDRVLDELYPGRLDSYYAAWDQVDAAFLEGLVNRVARAPVQRLALFLELFRREQFLYDYADSERLLFRLNQVMKRVRLAPIAPDATWIFEEGAVIVRQRWRDLLPSEHFDVGGSDVSDASQ